MQWYYAINGQRHGPVTQADFDQLVSTGQIKADMLVWRQGMANWVSYGSLTTGSVASVVSAVSAEASPGALDTEVCVVSGKRYPRREMIQFEGKWISAEHRDEFFQRLREGVAIPGASGLVPGPFGYGGFWRRFFAKFVDSFITGVVGAGCNVLVAYAIFGEWNYLGLSRREAGTSDLLLYQAITLPLGILIGLAYAWFFISRYQATPGKMALGLKLVRADGSALTTGRIVGRYFAEILSGLTLLIGYIMAGFDEQKRSLHDRICDTRVIKVR
ncbi:MAG: RDD family protein [Opitutaceae bacterium]